MSKIGKKIIFFPANIRLEQKQTKLQIFTSQNKSNLIFPNTLQIKILNSCIFICPINFDIKTNTLYGYFRSALFNSILGTYKFFYLYLIADGLGYKFLLETNNLVRMRIGFYSFIEAVIPQDIIYSLESETILLIKSLSKTSLTTFATFFRSKSFPEPYKGKGIIYKNEKAKRKKIRKIKSRK